LLDELLRDEEADVRAVLRAVARPPFAPARFFCAVEPPRVLPFRDDAVLRVLVLRDVVLRAVVFFAAVFRLAVFRAVVLRAAVFLRAVVFFPAVVFFRPVFLLLDEDPDDEDFDEDFASPVSARCLLTVRAAISLARLVDRPCFCSDSLTCSY
jgi:hypothetical protein